MKKRYTFGQYFRAGIGFIKKTYAWCIGHIFYKSKYLKGKEFDRYRFSSGWHWVLENVFMQKIVGYQRHIPFPVSYRSRVLNWENIVFDLDSIGVFQNNGNYFQAAADAHIYIGKGTYIASNVGIITANHDLNDLTKAAAGKDVRLGENCWIGMNSTILPGVTLGEHTIVGAGSVVTKSFPEGHCVIAGNPAKVIRTLEKNEESSAETT